MRRIRRLGTGLLAIAALLSLPVEPALSASRASDDASTEDVTPDQQAQIALGRQIFTRDWSQPESSESVVVLGDGGDGLGPMFNDISCAACHEQGGIGGSGPTEKNVELLHVMRPQNAGSGTRLARFLERASRIHAAFRSGTSLVLHRHGRDEAGETTAYRKWRDKLLGIPGDEPLSPAHPVRRIQRMQVRLTQRNTPPLFGAGVIDAIPDAVLIRTAEEQAKKPGGITGRVPQTSTGAVGRFGWRGQTATLHEFVLQACANELGLNVPGHAQPENPLKERQQEDFSGMFSSRTEHRVDLTEDECRALTAYVASLPAPELVRHNHLELSKSAMKGEELFNSIGCSACHVRDLGTAQGIYSDLLLHDMGPALSDPLAATPEMELGSSAVSGFYGGVSIAQTTRTRLTTNIAQEWRTPPLWGVRDSAPYVHDGRAETLEEAIRLHGGEAADSAAAFGRLTKADRERVLLFLNSLVAPEGEADHRNARGGMVGSGFFSVASPHPEAPK